MGSGGANVRALRPPSSLDEADVLLARALQRQPKSRGELAQETGWSRNTVAAKVGRLMDEGWVVETGDGRGDRGRPFVRYALNSAAALVFLARFDAEGIDAAVCTLAGDLVAAERHDLGADLEPERAVDQLAQLLDAMATRPGLDRRRIRAMVVGVPGPVSGRRRTVPWSKVGVLPADLAERFGMAVAVENDANLMALGARHEHLDVDSLLFLLVQTGIGAGLVLSGRLHRGLSGWAGEVGHIPVEAAKDRPCSCGNRGCLALVAANPALMRAISTPARPVNTVADLKRLVQSGDIDAIMALRQAGRHIGEAIVGLVVGAAPELIAVGGHIAEIGDHVITGIRETLAQKTPPPISSQIRIVATQDHDRAAVRGATDLAFDLLFPAAR
ncbi:Transcriptional regulator, ROK family [Rubellimicrobium mesophilum DSM 19309]|uniref:Transcriptional regulator, ROK family n=1 Tax=Rubellimicrobium mesophilum DSM 19309 TaxID=442562 RepID=A0A017HIW8_9RHOB|nr:ROK family transcriptional regulator [Rubellimicrobium mesophilum]EYD74280.1 Transcriptional regulator, ROK family [Rubellimicrobium mesophilum DSM 19309]